MITSEIKSFLDLHRLGYVATVTEDGLPNLSPKGTIIGWDENTLAFADIRSPDTMKNLQSNPNVEINSIDPLSRRGYLFSGKARILGEGNQYDEILSFYRDKGIKSPVGSIVLVDLSKVSEVTSPLYDMGIPEDEIRVKWKKHFENL